ncbi:MULTISPECIES: translocation/assembly module TamB domain-containing protein [unclassified Leeuwenhoekiella]|uniref:translocation/assembly module TamB domain-containing protein n=1 Tax=unclassified Leeuwenhoekiella TaxID=2615029 RepID=UPI000C687729|nr:MULTISPECIES: translocation/assembly module TamB domain-containing protein [unclassified Leeuwenhoekiella]MAW94557.1 hypothetical protein [Leeuwenhoekiella sp.]MBA81980.1 hypothetical protein [Leeuwenhoekiella sp.]|tara:strand:+ start:45476 stop:50452 length:4977 start_codon:yes stop_codon:yes gene_type:complete
MTSKSKKIFKKSLKIIAKIFGVILLLLLALILFVRSPWGQGILVDKAVNYIKSKTNTEVQIDNLFITFGGNLSLDGLYLEDKQGDTLVYSKHLEADIPLWSLIKGGPISIDDVSWNGLKANIIRKDSVSGFNYEFLVDAFASDTTTVQQTPQDTTALELNLGTFDFENFDLKFKDDVAGIDARLKLDELELDVDKTNLDQFVFDVGDVRLSNTSLFYKQTKPFPESADTTAAPMPQIRISSLTINNVDVDYASQPDGIALKADVGNLVTSVPQLNLKDQNYTIDGFLLENSIVNLDLETQEKASQNAQEPVPFSWPQMVVNAENVELRNTNFTYTLDGAQISSSQFNPNAVALSKLNLEIPNFNFKDRNLTATVASANFQEASGIDLKTLGFEIEATDENLNIRDLNLALNGNELSGSSQLSYTSLADFIEKPGNARLNLNLDRIVADLNTIFKFQPALRSNEYLATLSRRPVTGNLSASGNLSALDINTAQINWGNATNVRLRGTVYNLTEPEELAYNFPDYRITSSRSDINKFINEEELGVALPEDVKLNGSLKGTDSRLLTKSKLETSKGQVGLDGRLAFGDTIEFEGKVNGSQIQLGSLLQNESLGQISFNLDAQGSGATLNDLDASLTAQIDSLGYNNYTFKDLKLDGEFKNGIGTLTSAYKDSNLNMKLNADVELDSVASSARVNLDLIGADLQELGLVKQNIKAAFNLQANFKGTATDYEVQSEITRGVAVYDDEAYQLGDLSVNAFVKPDTTSVDIQNRILELDLESNTSPGRFLSAVQNHFRRYLDTNPNMDTIADPVVIRVRGTVHEAPILNEVFVPNLRQLDTVQIAINFNELKRDLNADINLPYINYNGYTIDSLAFTVNSDAEHLNFDFGLKELIAGPVDLQNTRLEGALQNSKLALDFSSMHKNERLMHIASEIELQDDVVTLHILPEELILNKNSWDVNPNNRIAFRENNTVFTDFVLSYNNQRVEAGNNLPRVSKEHLGVQFDNFKLSTITSFLNPDESLAKGKLSGTFAVEEPTTSPGMVTDLKIVDFEVMGTDMGVLTANGKSISSTAYDFDMSVKEGVADLDLTGTYRTNTTAAEIDLDLDINSLQMKALENFSVGEISNASGTVNGKLSLTGTTAEPNYEGTLNFDQAKFEVTKLNAPFLLANESIKLDNTALYFSDFKILDSSSNTLVVNGEVGTESFVNPTFDLDIKATNFEALNSTKDDFDLVYGRAVFDANASITGDLNLPKVDLDLTVKPETDLTYVVPPSEVQIESKDGVVIFVNKENPDAILTNSEEKSYTVSGFGVDAKLSIAKGATFNLVIDEQTGDNFQVSGTGDFQFDMYPNGRMTLSGRYNVTDGHYEMSLYGLVKRRFDLAPDSRITWSGDPFDADLDIKAYYSVETSASGLMASQTSGADISTQGQYRQEVPFRVYININGELMQPVISFNLDIPEGSRGAVGGQVYSRVQQLNQQENELNKQVFSLLVLNRFFPSASSDGSAGGTATIARDNLNDAISDQLNLFSDKLLGDTGFNLNFGLDSYTDYQGSSPSERTTLDIAAQKKLFDDRVVVSVGSNVDLQGSNTNADGGTAPVVGNVSIEYLLTEDGRYRLRGYRRSQFENVVDGQIIVNGISLLFTQEFNKFTELWKSMFPAKKEEENDKN